MCQPSASWSVEEIGNIVYIPGAWYLYSQGDSSWYPVESCMWCTSMRPGMRLHFQGNTFVAGVYPCCFAAFVYVALCRIKVWGQVLYLTKFQCNANFSNLCQSREFSPAYPPFLHQSHFSHRPLFSYHPPTQLSDYQFFLRFALILPIHTSSYQYLHPLR